MVRGPTPVPSALEAEAHALASRLLGHDPVRLAHVRGAAARARRVAAALPELDAVVLVSAAMVHDIGYSPAIADSGFHPVDGARYLQDAGWPDPVVQLVAHHSYAVLTAPYYAASAELARFPEASQLAADALTFADVSSGRDGRGCTPQQRIDDMRLRHGYDSRVPEQVREHRYGLLLAAAGRIARQVAGPWAASLPDPVVLPER